MTDSERVMEVIRVKGLTNVQFCNATGISAATLSHITSGRSNPTLTIMRSIIKGFPDLNPMWVYSGDGDMFLPTEAEPTPSADSTDASPIPIYNDEQTQAVRPMALDAIPQMPQPRTGRSGSMRQSADLFGDLDELANGGNASGMCLAANATLTDVVRETLIQVQPQQRRSRQITEIRIFFDDGTYESFGGPK